ncbi:hypothetical protein, partial [uncultured Desulfovibrio sp.]|uniref:hypothetical protein n=1 Tax=uncultured Desulfovibrio sp. TaxID=167968 RepID=UPI002602E7A6
MVEDIFSAAYQESSFLKSSIEKYGLHVVETIFDMCNIGRTDRTPMVGMDEDLYGDRHFFARQVSGKDMVFEIGGCEFLRFFTGNENLQIIAGIGDGEITRPEVCLIVEAKIPHVQAGDGHRFSINLNDPSLSLSLSL